MVQVSYVSVIQGGRALRERVAQGILSRQAAGVRICLNCADGGEPAQWNGSSLAPLRAKEARMAVINFLIIASLIATVVVLTLGLRSMSKGGAYDAEHAEKFMWERIALQSLVVVLLIAATILLNV
jgi:hypothetical protein